MEPQWETAGQGLAQYALLPWEQAFYPGVLGTVFGLRQRAEIDNERMSSPLLVRAESYPYRLVIT